MKILLITWLSLFSTFALGASQLWTHPLKDFSRKTHTVQQLAAAKPGNKSVLALFWADWCVPCKEELKIIRDHQAELDPNLLIVAVNVDEQSDKANAEVTLRAIKWPFISLWDEAGQLFGELRQTFELPYGVLLSPQGEKLKEFSKLAASDLPQISRLVQTETDRAKSTETRSSGIQIEASSQVYVRTHKIEHSDEKNTTLALTLGTLQRGEHWLAQASYDALRQWGSRDDKQDRWEDELGMSFIEWLPLSSTTSASDVLQLRFGDRHLLWQNGLLLSLRLQVDADEQEKFTGLSAVWSRPNFSFELIAGKVRNHLYSPYLDASRDISTALPESRIAGGIGKVNLAESDSLGLSLNFGAVSLLQLKDVDLGLVDDKRQDRYSAGLSAALFQTLNVDYTHAIYRMEDKFEKEGLEDPRAQRLDTLWTAYHNDANGALLRSIDLGVSVLDVKGAPEFTFISQLNQETTLPLDSEEKQGYSVRPVIGLAGSHVIEPQYVAERSKLDDEEMRTGSLKYSLSSASLKIMAARQQKSSAIESSEYREDFVTTIFPILGETISGSGDYRGYSIHRSGKRVGGGLTLLLHRLASTGDTFSFSVLGSKQDGNYIGESGIDKRFLNSYRLSYNYPFGSLSVHYGQEPGGVVCNAGACTVRPPLNGIYAGWTFSMSI